MARNEVALVTFPSPRITYIPRIGSGGPAGTVDHTDRERIACWLAVRPERRQIDTSIWNTKKDCSN